MTHTQEIIFAIALGLLLILSAFFSASETALMSVNRYRLRHRMRHGHRTAMKVLDLLKRPDRLLGVVLIGNTAANIIASSLVTILGAIYGEIGVAIGMGLLTLVVLIFSEIAPKTIAAAYAEKISFFVVWPLSFMLKIFYPLVWLLNAVTNAGLHGLGFKTSLSHTADRLTSEELSSVVAESADNFSVQHKEMLLGILELEKMRVEDVMLPRNKIEGIDLEAPLSQITKVILKSRQVRVPVYSGSIDHIMGVLPMNEAFHLLAMNQLTKKNLQRALEKPYFVPEVTMLSTQLHQFKVLHRSSAFVVDEYGDIQGLVTVEDIVEEIVGSVEAEVNAFEKNKKSIVQDKQGRYLISGEMLVREVNKQLQWNLPEAGPKTMSGLVLEWLETIPEGPVCVSIYEYRIEVLQTVGSQIQKIRATLASYAPAA